MSLLAHYMAAAGQARRSLSPADAYRAAVLTDNPVGLWTLGESTGITATDEVAGDDGDYSPSSSGSWTGGVLGGGGPFSGGASADFDGSTGHVDAPLTVATAPVSVELWCNLDSTTDQVLVAAFQRSSANINWIVRCVGGKFRFQAKTTGNVVHYSSDVTASTGWHHLVGTFDGSTAKIYVDAVASSGIGTAEYSSTGTAPAMRIGGWHEADGSTLGAATSGQLAWVATYDSVLSPARISAHYGAAGY